MRPASRRWLLGLGCLVLCFRGLTFAPLARLRPQCPLRPSVVLWAQGDQLEYFDVYTKEEFVALLSQKDGQRSVGEQEKIERMVGFLEGRNPSPRGAESILLVGKWELAFCGVLLASRGFRHLELLLQEEETGT
ncbi:hypothetical protein AK812_SmicGene38275 [Symbiodinium microadriaticum]|uniref:Uncharacterized protein n=1 Tax=Symbiodinium microadriaticum TaxID=2951 RepID=A0A1Q9CE69_SYMMI|nr:hypothetical protein AK812_SmicGene38275 [Symbiodinium microadriaticum]